MTRINKLFVLIITGAALISCSPLKHTAGIDTRKAKNVIFLIGDGMGSAQVYAAITASNKPLNIERMQSTGFQKTYSANAYITDSGAAGTALATGTKTNNGAIGVDPKGNVLKSILEIAEENGLSTGLVASASVTHATPASFIAHQGSRGSYEDIASDFLQTDIDLFIGGGLNHFTKRTDGKDLTETLRANGYAVETTLDGVLKSNASKLAGLIYDDQPPYRLKGRGDMLPATTAKAIEILSKNKKGFFLMVEGSQIDWAGHANAADTLIDETLDFDRAIGVALDFAAKNKRTLVVVTGDHETGGVTITGGDINLRKTVLSFSTRGHSGITLPVYASGPGAYKFTGIYDNTRIPMKILEAFRFPAY